MFEKSKNIKRFSIEVGIPIFISILLVSLVRTLGIMQFLEWKGFDLLFFLRPPEPTDERIVIVTFDEKDLRSLEESVLSDRSLVTLLKKIKSQNPRAIGLDLYRDIPESSSKLTKAQNEKAYRELQQVYRSTPNLIGIEKIVPPLVKPAQVLKEQNQIAASDVLVDPDGTIRRGYLYPNLSNESKAQIPGLGWALAYFYLQSENINPNANDAGWLKLENVVFEKFEANDGGYVRANDLGYPILINWRKGTTRFRQISVSQVLANEIPSEIFSDRLVLIGNVSSSTGDRFYLPFYLWSGTPPDWVYGVEVHSQIASYIISTVLDGRPLIRVSPDWLEYILLLLSTTTVAFLGNKWRNFPPLKLLVITSAGSIILAILLLFSSYFAFLFGWWIGILPSLLGLGIALIIININTQIVKLQEAKSDLETLIEYIAHGLKNPLGSIDSSTIAALNDCQTIKEKIAEAEPYLGIEMSAEIFSTDHNQPVTTEIERKLENIKWQIERVTSIIDEISTAIELEYLERKSQAKLTDLNWLLHESLILVSQEKEQRSQNRVNIEENYAELEQVEIFRESLQHALINLIDNAYDAVNEKKEVAEEGYVPQIAIATKNLGGRIEIIVADNGKGVSYQMREKVFLPFKTTKLKGRGRGLGLFIARQVAIKHGGDIRLETKEGEGSKFTLVLSKNVE